jgi:hypothetical protein
MGMGAVEVVGGVGGVGGTFSRIAQKKIESV